MISEKIEKLIVKYLCNQAAASDLDELEAWIEQPGNEALFKTYVKIKYGVDYNVKAFNKEKVKAKLLGLIDEENRVIKLKTTRRYLKYAAAILVVGLMVSGYFFKDQVLGSTTSTSPQITNTHIIEPGSQKAILTLEDGAQIVLQKGEVFATQKVKSNGEEIVYTSQTPKAQTSVYNHITVPRGGEFTIKLSDGTQVWLNSESQLKYPVAFQDGQTRVVELVYGEAYFDVSPSTNHQGSKFKVMHNSQNVEVYGTEFNIKAYRDETNIYTTLVEGSVGVFHKTEEKKLVPGQQSNLDIATSAFSVKKVDVYNELSWKEGVFSFERMPLKDIMKVLSRWYDFNVMFASKDVETEKFIGVLGRDQNIEDILSSIKGSGIIKNYKINDNEKTIVLE